MIGSFMAVSAQRWYTLTDNNQGRVVPLQITKSPDIADKLRRFAWGVTWLLFYRPTPVPLHGWRRFLLRLFGAQIGKGAHPYPTAHIWAPWNLRMNDDSCLGPGAECYNVAKITLGISSIVSQRAHLCAAGHDFRDVAFPLVTGEITIEDHAWIATEAFVGPGITVGANAVVGARAVVMRDVAADAVVAGNPATVIGTRK